MRLKCRRVLSVHGAYSACSGPELNQWVVGRKDGTMNLYGSDGSLEKVASVGSKPVLVTRVYSGACVCYISGNACGVYDFHRRKIILSFDTTSAHTALSEPSRGVLVVVSKRKVRWTEDLRKVHVIPTEEKLSTIAFKSSYEIICVSGGSLMRLDLLTGEQSAAGLPRIPSYWRTPQFSLVLVKDTIIVGVGSDVYSATESNAFSSKVTWKNGQAPKALISQEPFYLALFSDRCDLVNPEFGTVYATADVEGGELRLPPPGSAVVDASGVIDFGYEVSIDDLENMENLSEAASLAARLPELKSDTSALQFRYAAELFEKKEISRALAIYNSLEADDQVASLAMPLLEQPVQDNERPIRMVASYLAEARRKLRIRDHAFSEVIDNALFRCYVHMHSPLVGPLLRSKNRCTEFVVRQLLPEESHWKVITEFYKSHEQHEAALKLLAAHSDTELAAYLENLGPSEPELVLNYARDLIQRYGEKFAKPLFWDERWPSSVEIFKYLREISPSMAFDYLVHRIAVGDGSPEIHELYAQQLEGDELTIFLKRSTCYRPDVLLETLTSEHGTVSLPATVILYCRLGHHAEAVDTYLTANEYDAAIEYVSQHGGVFHLLNRLLAQPERQPVLIKLLNICGPPTALEMLPDTLKAAELGPYLIQRARESASEMQGSKITAALRYLDLGNTSVKLADSQKQFVVVEPTSMCAVCRKRLGLAVLGVRDKKAVHFGCL